MIEQSIKAHLSTAVPSVGNRVHIGNAFQDSELPVVVIRRVSGSTPRTLGGQALFSRAQFTINVVGLDYASVMPVTEQVRQALHGFTGEMGVAPALTKVRSARCLAEPADFSELDGDVTLRVMSQEFSFVYSET